jgi:redox-sensitive bicupin YhaK (pirin superfamily)
MSNRSFIIEERSRDIGSFLVGRLLPFRKKRMVGPFIYIDHMGPSQVGPDHYMDIGPHPHIGLSTLTYLFEGEVMHRDSLGTEQRILPGAVNWMTAGKGIVHSERTPEDIRKASYTIHGYQIWVALPADLEQMEPYFYHADAESLPQWTEDGMNFILVAGEAFGFQSPVPVHSKLYMIDVRAQKDASWSPEKLYGETAICIVEGSIETCGERLEKGHLLVAKPDEQCEIQIHAGSHLLIFGGEPFPEQRQIFWNFVASDEALINRAKEDWKDDRFPHIPGETDRIPLP